jgi:predicted transcriptional regulator
VSVDAVFTALADPTRREVIVALAREPRLTASRLAGELPVTRQAVAKHLATLDRAGLVRADHVDASLARLAERARS